MAGVTRTIAIIGGSGYGKRLQGERREVETPFGRIPILVSEHAGKRIVAIKRHGEGHDIPPHMVNYRGNVWVAKEVGAEAILGSTAVGVIRRTWLSRLLHAPQNQNYKRGDLILLKDVIADGLRFGDGKVVTFFDDFKDGIHHTDCSKVFDARLKSVLKEAARREGMRLKDGAIHVTTLGPQFETPAEIRKFRGQGVDVVGMTTGYEAKLARELEIPLCLVAIGTNWCAGMGGTLSHQEVVEMMERKGEEVNKLILKAIEIM